jgi:FO synthase
MITLTLIGFSSLYQRPAAYWARWLWVLSPCCLGSLPDTAAEILNDPVRKLICPDKLTTDQWLGVVGTAHAVGLRTTSTIMFGHLELRCPWGAYFVNIQASWVKMGHAGLREALRVGANDIGGTLMNESISRAAGAMHGQEMTVREMHAMAASLGRRPVRRTTLYEQPGPAKESHDHRGELAQSIVY